MDLDDDEVEVVVIVCLAAAAMMARVRSFMLPRAERTRSFRGRLFVRAASLISPDVSPIARLLDRRDVVTFMKYLRLDVTSFDKLLVCFARVYDCASLTGGTSGRPSRRALSSRMALALVVRYLVSGVSSDEQCLEFGISPATRSRVLRVGMACLLQAWEAIPAARIAFPTHAECHAYADRVTNMSGGIVRNCIGFLDGIILHLERPGDAAREHWSYNAYKAHNGYKMLVLFGADGAILYANVGNGRGSDGMMFNELEVMLYANAARDRADACRCGQHFVVLGDNAFRGSPVCARSKDFKSRPDVAAAVQRVRNCAEIGLGSFVNSIRVLKLRMCSDDDDMLMTTVRNALHLYNFRNREVKIGQLRTLFDRGELWLTAASAPSSVRAEEEGRKT